MIEELTHVRLRKHDVAHVVKEILACEARTTTTPDVLADDEALNSDRLRINSLAFIGVAISIEEALDIRLEDELFMTTKFETVGNLVDFVYRAYQAQSKKQQQWMLPEV